MVQPLCVAGPEGAGPCRSPEACDKLRHCVAPNYRKLPNRLVSSLKTDDELEVYVLGRIAEALAGATAQPTIPPGMKLVPVEDPRVVDDLAALVGRLAWSLKNAKPDSDLPAQALDYLKRMRVQGSPLREAGGTAAPQPTTDIVQIPCKTLELVKAILDDECEGRSLHLTPQCDGWKAKTLVDEALAAAPAPQPDVQRLMKLAHDYAHEFGVAAGSMRPDREQEKKAADAEDALEAALREALAAPVAPQQVDALAEVYRLAANMNVKMPAGVRDSAAFRAGALAMRSAIADAIAAQSEAQHDGAKPTGG